MFYDASFVSISCANIVSYGGVVSGQRLLGRESTQSVSEPIRIQIKQSLGMLPG